MEATQEGAPDQETLFQSFFDQGAFDANQTPPENQQADPEPPATPEPAAQQEAEPAQAEQQTEQQGEQEGDPESWESLDQFLTANELNPEEFRQIPVTVKIDGQERNIPLSDVIKSYQLEGHVNNKSIELSNQQKAFEAEQQAARELISQQLKQNAALSELAMQQLTYEFQSIDWNAMRQSDPANYAALMTDYNNRYGQIQNHLSQIQQQQQEAAQKDQETKSQTLQKERELMLQVKPEWNNHEVFTKDAGEISQYAKKLGYTDAEIGSISDHRWMQVMHDAARYAALQAKTPAAVKRVKEAPKMQAKPGTRQNRDPKQIARQQAIENFNKNPGDIDAQAALFEFLAN